MRDQRLQRRRACGRKWTKISQCIDMYNFSCPLAVHWSCLASRARSALEGQSRAGAEMTLRTRGTLPPRLPSGRAHPDIRLEIACLPASPSACSPAALPGNRLVSRKSEQHAGQQISRLVGLLTREHAPARRTRLVDAVSLSRGRHGRRCDVRCGGRSAGPLSRARHTNRRTDMLVRVYLEVRFGRWRFRVQFGTAG